MTIIQIGIGILATIMMIIAIEFTIQFGIFVVYFILSKQEHRHKKNDIESAATREQEKMSRKRLKEKYKNDIYF